MVESSIQSNIQNGIERDRNRKKLVETWRIFFNRIEKNRMWRKVLYHSKYKLECSELFYYDLPWSLDTCSLFYLV